MKILLLFISLFASQIYAQSIQQKGDFNTTEFPIVKFKVNVVNPNIKQATDFKLSENNLPLEFEFEHLEKNIEDKTKLVLFLWEDMTHNSHANQKETFQDILKNALPKFVKPNDKINIALFDRNRDGSTPLYFALNNFTDDTSKLIDAVKNYKKPINNHFSNNISSDLYNAIYDGMAYLKKNFPDKNKTIVVLSAGKNLELSNYNSIGDLVLLAKKDKIAVYSMQYMLWEHENIDVLATESYGKYFHIQGAYKLQGNHSKNDASAALVSFMNHSVERHYGQDYQFTFESSFDKDGKLHALEISTDNSSETFSYKAANCDFKCQFNKKPLLYSAIAFAILLLLIIIFFILRNNAKKKEALQEEQRKAIEYQISKQDDEISKQKAKSKQLESQAIKEKKRRQKEQAFKEEQDKLKKLEEQKQATITQMKKMGFPILKVSFNNQNFEWLVNLPIVSIGRNSSNIYSINDNHISGNHLKIVFQNNEYFIEDLNSSNGTFVNGKKINISQLKHNDVIDIGNVKIMFLK